MIEKAHPNVKLLFQGNSFSYKAITQRGTTLQPGKQQLIDKILLHRDLRM